MTHVVVYVHSECLVIQMKLLVCLFHVALFWYIRNSQYRFQCYLTGDIIDEDFNKYNSHSILYVCVCVYFCQIYRAQNCICNMISSTTGYPRQQNNLWTDTHSNLTSADSVMVTTALKRDHAHSVKSIFVLSVSFIDKLCNLIYILIDGTCF